MTPEQAALYRGILINPHDDAPRLIYADWLDESHVDPVLCSQCGGDGKEYNDSTLREYTCRKCNGNGKIAGNGFAEQAEFIRSQIELAKSPPAPLGFPCDYLDEADRCYKCTWCKWAKETSRRMDELMRISARWVNGKIATAEYHKDPRLYGLLPTWNRGFIDQLQIPLRNFLETCRGLVESYPITKWLIIDKHPFADSIDKNYGWGSNYHHHEQDANNHLQMTMLPLVIMGDPEAKILQGRFASSQESQQALQEFCYRYARRDLTATEGECHEKQHH